MPKRLPFAGMVSQMRPVVHQLVEEAIGQGYPRAGGPLDVLEAGSSGGLLASLLRETALLEQMACVDFADAFPDTLEGAVERSEGWPCRCHYINSGIEHLASPVAYDVILTWASFSRPGAEESMAQVVAARQKPGGLLLQVHDQADLGRLGFALHRFRLLATHVYATSAGREPKCASAWGLT